AKIDEIEQREKDRVAKHETTIQDIEGAGRAHAERWMTMPLDYMRDTLAEIESGSCAGDQEEFAPLYAQAITTATAQIRDAIAKRETHDAEQAELIRLREAEETRKREEDAERLRKEGEERARREAEEAAQKERERAERAAREERDAAARREQDLKDAADKAEKDRIAAEARAANAQREAEEKLRREAEEQAQREAAEREKREANKRHRAAINNAAKQAFVKGGLNETAAQIAVTLIAAKQVPNVEIKY
ncbi:MAG: hypothetical protein NUV34_06200, partial [Sulfuricaulis sp.]|nr:hypothetical protein [Sulfuricaulis sp.]